VAVSDNNNIDIVSILQINYKAILNHGIESEKRCRGVKFIPTPFYDKPLPLFIANPYPFSEKH
jgi:hypothetical protein